MCFQIHQDFPNALIAQEDIKVFKILENVQQSGIKGHRENAKYYGYSPFRSYVWVEGQTEEQNIEVEVKRTKLPSGGDEFIPSEDQVKSSYFEYKYINKGLHAYVTERRAQKEIGISLYNFGAEQYFICECIIPKGTTYYKNLESNEIVAEKMKWTGRIRKEFLFISYWGRL